VLLVCSVVTACLIPMAQAAATPTTCGLAAHRGDHTTYTENSLNAMSQAITDGADYLELDIRPDADRTLYLMHNRTVDKTTDGTGPIAHMTDRQVRRLRLDDGERVPTLADVFTMAKPSSVHVLAEMKAMSGKGTYRSLARLVRQLGRSRVLVTSFFPPLLHRLHRTAPRIKRAIITKQALTPDEVAPYGAIVVKFTAITDAWLSEMTFPVYAWTPDDPTEWEGLATRVRAIITNEPVAFEAYRRTACAT
jgi:glycerophosphoryl diester phosphodiesterase